MLGTMKFVDNDKIDAIISFAVFSMHSNKYNRPGNNNKTNQLGRYERAASEAHSSVRAHLCRLDGFTCGKNDSALLHEHNVIA